MKLDVWLEAVPRPVGTLERKPDKSLCFAYAPETGPEGRLSIALPLRDAPTEDVTRDALERFMAEIGFARPLFGAEWRRLLRDVATTGLAAIEAAGGKPLADAVAAQLSAVETAAGIGLRIPERDRYPRNVRDVKPAGPGG